MFDLQNKVETYSENIYYILYMKDFRWKSFVNMLIIPFIASQSGIKVKQNKHTIIHSWNQSGIKVK